MHPAILQFTGDYRWLSNFWPSNVQYAGVSYGTVENAYQAAKTDDPEARLLISTVFPGKAKRIGQTVRLVPEWETIKLGVMEDLLRQKFSDQYLREKLLATEDAFITEGNNWHDNFWGKCSCEKCADKQKYNMLGKLIMKIREELR